MDLSNTSGANKPTNTAIEVSHDVITMTSLEIAELTGKEHRNVMRDIRNMLSEIYPDGDTLNFEHIHFVQHTGQSYKFFKLPKRETLILVSGYNVVLRAKIIDRWQELEAQAVQMPMIPRTLPEALRAYADELDGHTETKRQLAHTKQELIEVNTVVSELKPKAIGFDQISNCEDGSMCISDVAKVVGKSPKQMFRFLQNIQWIYRRREGEQWKAYQDKVDNGLMVHKVIDVDIQGRKTIQEQVRITPLGLTQITILCQGTGILL